MRPCLHSLDVAPPVCLAWWYGRVMQETTWRAGAAPHFYSRCACPASSRAPRSDLPPCQSSESARAREREREREGERERRERESGPVSKKKTRVIPAMHTRKVSLAYLGLTSAAVQLATRVCMQCVSVLSHVSCARQEDYVRIASVLARSGPGGKQQHLGTLKRIRSQVESQRGSSPLFDTDLWVSHFQRLLRSMWETAHATGSVTGSPSPRHLVLSGHTGWS